METKTSEMKSFNRKIWMATSIVATFVIIVWILKATFNVLLLVLAAALIALYFHGVSTLLQRKLHMRRTASKQACIYAWISCSTSTFRLVCG